MSIANLMLIVRFSINALMSLAVSNKTKFYFKEANNEGPNFYLFSSKA